MSANSTYPLLDQLTDPAQLRQFSESQLTALSDEVRAFLIETVARTGGHLAAGLGVVELTVALHHVFDTPRDRLVWDVGHQAYPHKILTGRRGLMHTLRQQYGLAGFPSRAESPYDTFGVGHSSTSISAALGMALAARDQGSTRKVVAVIGDGALGAGMAFEAMNHAGSIDDLDLLLVLNDNDMSISQPVGALNNHLARLLSGSLYTSVRQGSKQALNYLPPLKEFMGRWEEHMKGMLMPGTLFEELGFNYIGPVDGHDLPTLLATLRNMKAMGGCRLLHVITQKGRGYLPAEGDPVGYHGVRPFDRATGNSSPQGAGKTYTEVFGEWLLEAGQRDERLLAITPAMTEGSGMTEFARRFPQRFFDVGIAEQHALTLAAGMACEGAKPVVAIYSTFLQRAYDQLIHDLALQNLDVTLAVDRGGLVGPDGATHAGVFDLGYCRMVPNLLVLAPASLDEARLMLEFAYRHPGPALVRYPRGGDGGAADAAPSMAIEMGRGRLLRSGARVALLSFGALLSSAAQVAEELDCSLADMRFVKPLDEDLVLRLAAGHQALVSIEDNMLQGGAGSAVAELLACRGVGCELLILGIPDRFVEHASREQQLAACGLDASGLAAAVRARFGNLIDASETA